MNDMAALQQGAEGRDWARLLADEADTEADRQKKRREILRILNVSLR